MSKILVIDDDSVIRILLKTVLEKSSYCVTVAEDGLIGQILFEKNDFDLVITDLVMPVQEGIETIVNLKKHKTDIPIIAISGGTYNESLLYLDVAKQLGAEYALTKPLVINDLLCAVEDCLLRLKDKY